MNWISLIIFQRKYLEFKTYVSMIHIDEKIKESIKNKNAAALRVFRNLKTDIMNFTTQKNAPEYTYSVEVGLIKKYVTKMEDAEKQYLEAGREDLVQECREELDILRTLLPASINPEEIEHFLWEYGISNEIIYESKLIIPKKSMGSVIKLIKETYPTADGKLVSDIVKKYVC